MGRLGQLHRSNLPIHLKVIVDMPEEKVFKINIANVMAGLKNLVKPDKKVKSVDEKIDEALKDYENCNRIDESLNDSISKRTDEGLRNSESRKGN